MVPLVEGTARVEVLDRATHRAGIGHAGDRKSDALRRGPVAVLQIDRDREIRRQVERGRVRDHLVERDVAVPASEREREPGAGGREGPEPERGQHAGGTRVPRVRDDERLAGVQRAERRGLLALPTSLRHSIDHAKDHLAAFTRGQAALERRTSIRQTGTPSRSPGAARPRRSMAASCDELLAGSARRRSTTFRSCASGPTFGGSSAIETSRPPGRMSAGERSRRAPPTVSKTRSTGSSGPRDRRRTRRGPRARRSHVPGRHSAGDVVPITYAPRARASCVAR